jgi:flagellar biosynthesis protein FlhB
MTKSKLSLIFSAVLFILFCSMAWTASGFQALASYFPLSLSVIGIFLTLGNMIAESRKLLQHHTQATQEEDQQNDAAWDIPVTQSFKIAAFNFLWVLCFFAFIFLFGFLIATAIFLMSFLKKRTDFNWTKIALAVFLTIGLLTVLGDAMDLRFPAGIIGIY